MYKMMMGMMMKMLKAKLKESDEPKAKEMVDKFEEGFDFVSEENLGELVEFLSK
jgi:hypothetical protein